MAILFSTEFAKLVAEEPLVYIDAGARGGLEGPWGDIEDDRLRVVAFEPDPDGCARLQRARGPRVDAVAKALWSNEGFVDIHLAPVRSASSVHPPNAALLERYAVEHSRPRVTEQTIAVPCTTLDRALAALGISADFLKIDTQGAEYEILRGARNSLGTGIFGVLTETWTTEVHRGQKLAGDVLSLMHQGGYELFDMNIAAAWWRRGSGAARGKRQITGLDFLFFKDPPAWGDTEPTPAKIAKAAAIAELYGFPDFALEMIDGYSARNPVDGKMLGDVREQIAHPKGETSGGWVDRIRRKLKPAKQRVAKLHY